MDIIQALKEELQIGRNQVEAAVKLIDEGNTIPFIARYRKEATGSLNDEVLRQLDERLRYLRNLEDKKEQVIGAIRAQEKLTPALEKQIRDAATLVAVEDLYLPYRPKRRTRAGIAREKGLEPLAVWIYKQEAGGSLEAEAAKYVSEEKGVADVSEAIDGARDILAEQISEMAKYRNYARKKTMQDGLLEASAKDEKIQSVYEMYYHFSEPVKKLAGHRVLAINRGEREDSEREAYSAGGADCPVYGETADYPPGWGCGARDGRSDSGQLPPPDRTGDRARDPRGADRNGRERRDSGIWQEPGTAPDAAADRRMRGARLGSGIPDGLQAGSCG